MRLTGHDGCGVEESGGGFDGGLRVLPAASFSTDPGEEAFDSVWCDHPGQRRENVIVLGPSGTGKTHVALRLGLAACQKGLSVVFITVIAQVSEMM